MATPVDEADIFNIARQIGHLEARRQYLDQICEGNSELRQRIDALLVVNDLDTKFLQSPPYQNNALDGNDKPGTQIGNYKLVEEIGEGGFGVVYMAEQKHPIRRTVALKILKPGMDTKQVVARFEVERQALALMDHPNIGRVLDGGETPNGRPYFVMELVKGIPITRYADENRLTLQQRLTLFADVCSAVQHAHQKGIIHRDLKPGNVLVAAYDGKPVAKLIDFGVAKALGQQLTERTLITGFGGIIGTLEYMSPEQAEFNAMDVDTRSDIYSLGVLLYELLTGTTPLTHERLRSAAMTEVLRMIREVEPPRPSLRLSDSHDTLASISAQRRLDPRELTKVIRGDLDWIVMKALAKERDRRYASASGLAMDIQRYLVDEPVLAGPPSAWYCFARFSKRHRGLVAMASLILLSLLAGIIGTTYGMMEAQHQKKEAEAARDDEKVARKHEALRAQSEHQALIEAQRRQTQLETGNEIFASIFDLLDIRKYREAHEPLEAALAKNLTNAVKKLDGQAMGDPLVVARMQMSIGNALLALGYASQATELFVKARATRQTLLGPEHEQTLSTMNNLAQAYQADGKNKLAVPLFEQTLELRKRLLGADHRETLISMTNLASAYQDTSKVKEAINLLRESLTLQEKQGNHEEGLLSTMNNLAEAYRKARNYDLAEELFQKVFEIRKEKLGPNHDSTLTSMNNLAVTQQAKDRLDLAIPLFKETLQRQLTAHGPGHPRTMHALNNLAAAYQADNKLELALPLYVEALALSKAKFPLDHPDTLRCMNNLAAGYYATGKFEEAMPLFDQVLTLQKEKLPTNNEPVLITMYNLARCCQFTGKLDRAELMLRDFIELAGKKLVRDSPQYTMGRDALGECLLLQKRWADAEPLLREAYERSLKKKSRGWRSYHSQSMWGGSMLALHRLADAAPHLQEGYSGLVAQASSIPPHWRAGYLIDALDRLIVLSTEQNKPEDAAKWRAEKAKWTEKK